MKSYEITSPDTTIPQAQISTPLVVRAIGAGVGLFLVPVLLLGWIAERDMTVVLKIGAGLFCVPIVALVAGDIASVIQATAEKITRKDLNMSGAVGDRPDIRLIPVAGSSHTIGGVEPEDWRFFINTICATQDWTQATWRGASMPSGRRCDNEYWERLTKPLKAARVIVNAGPRATGELVVTDPTVILEMLGVNSN